MYDQARLKPMDYNRWRHSGIKQKRGKNVFVLLTTSTLVLLILNEATEFQVNLASAISQTLRRDLRSVIPYPLNPAMHDKMKKTLTAYVQWVQ